MPGEEISSVYCPGIGSCASSTGESWREISAHSSTVIVPSGRSAMICTVVPLRPETDHPNQAKAQDR